jgi:hypothetical protein
MVDSRSRCTVCAVRILEGRAQESPIIVIRLKLMPLITAHLLVAATKRTDLPIQPEKAR